VLTKLIHPHSTGTSSILSEQNLQPRLGLLANLVETCVALRAAGHKVVLVSSGAIGMGRRRMSLLDGGLQGRWGKKPKSLNEKQASALPSYYTHAFSS
jgi:glutamate 5-kinase